MLIALCSIGTIHLVALDRRCSRHGVEAGEHAAQRVRQGELAGGAVEGAQQATATYNSIASTISLDKPFLLERDVSSYYSSPL